MQAGGSTDRGHSQQSRAASRSDWERDQISRILSTITSEISCMDVGTSATLTSQSANECLYFCEVTDNFCCLFDIDVYMVTFNNLTLFFGLKKVKEHIAVNGYSISQLRDVTCHMGSHSVTCHPTQVNTPHLNRSQ